MQKAIKVKGITIGEGMPKICVPIVGRTEEEILSNAKSLTGVPFDLVEWRADWYQDVTGDGMAEIMLQKLRRILGEVPLLFTFRSQAEGGEQQIETEEYVKLNRAVCVTGNIDFVDVELFMGDEAAGDIIKTAHEHQVCVIASNHDFDKTPDADTLVARMKRMQSLGADIPKIAVMPQSVKDVLTLLSATETMASSYAKGPIITMSMAGSGVISRLGGEIFGSAITFGSAGKASAPGQIDCTKLQQVLKLIHQSL